MSTSPDTLPSHYETQQTTTTTTRSSSLDMSYIRSIDGILKIVEMVFSFCLFITGTVGGWIVGMGMLSFTGIASLITVAILFVLRLLTLYSKLPQSMPFNLIHLVHYAIWDVCYLICAIISSVCAVASSTCAAGAFFSWVGLVVYGVDTFFTFQRYRNGTPPSPEVHTTTTTVETTHY